MDLVQWLLLLHVAATWHMVGVIWFVQLVHYPMFVRLAEADFAASHRHHTRFTTWVVAPPMLVEMATAVALVFVLPGGWERLLAWVGLELVVLIWLSTALLQVPCHKRLALGLDTARCRILCRGNWIRTIAWSVRGVIALWLLTM